MVDTADPSELRNAIEAMFFGYRAFTDRADQILKGHGLGRVHHRILYFVGRRPGVSVKGLLLILSVTKQAINAPLRELIDRKLVVMIPGDTDRRLKHLRLTRGGESLEAELTGTQMTHLARAFEVAGPGGRGGWKKVMDALGDGGV